jgi:hypothetical protein
VISLLKQLSPEILSENRIIEVWNKIDLLTEPLDMDKLSKSEFPVVPISAEHGSNIKKLEAVMQERLNLITGIYHSSFTNFIPIINFNMLRQEIANIETRVRRPPLKTSMAFQVNTKLMQEREHKQNRERSVRLQEGKAGCGRDDPVPDPVGRRDLPQVPEPVRPGGREGKRSGNPAKRVDAGRKVILR